MNNNVGCDYALKMPHGFKWRFLQEGFSHFNNAKHFQCCTRNLWVNQWNTIAFIAAAGKRAKAPWQPLQHITLKLQFIPFPSMRLQLRLSFSAVPQRKGIHWVTVMQHNALLPRLGFEHTKQTLAARDSCSLGQSEVKKNIPLLSL